MKTDTYPLIQIKNLSKSFLVGDQDVMVLKGITLDIMLYDFLIIYGPSGCGKSTLLHSMLGLESPSSGLVSFFGKNLYTGMTETNLADFRKRHIGMVYQQPNWIKALNVVENVAFPLLLLGTGKKTSMEVANEILDRVGMIKWANYLPMELSSGQQQMVELARALVHNPDVIIADEPTGNLDYATGQSLMEYLAELNKIENKTIIMVTHDLDYLKFAKTRVEMFDGTIKNVSDGKDKYINVVGKKHNHDDTFKSK